MLLDIIHNIHAAVKISAIKSAENSSKEKPIILFIQSINVWIKSGGEWWIRNRSL